MGEPAEKEVEAALDAYARVQKTVLAIHHAPAIRAALTAAAEARGDGWNRDMIAAPKDGTPLDAVVDGAVRIVTWGKTSHVPFYGFCLADQGAEEFDLCEPTYWRLRPPLP